MPCGNVDIEVLLPGYFDDEVGCSILTATIQEIINDKQKMDQPITGLSSTGVQISLEKIKL